MSITPEPSVVPFTVTGVGTGVAQSIEAGGHRFETDADDKQFRQLISETARRCPVTQLYQRSGVEFHNAWTKADLLVAVG